MHKKFNHNEIEKKWQSAWKEADLYSAPLDSSDPSKKYILVELPYPSGNLHIGHWYAFAIPDIYVRFLRMTGHTVCFPIGFDAFGLPAENAAIKRGIDPKAWTDSNIEYMTAQLERMGNAFSWNTLLRTTDTEYYAWTQWMFTEFFKKKIAYRGTGVVNWCPGCHTVIANEQVLSDGSCERSGDTIERRQMPQWMLRITEYADRLIDDLDDLSWPEHIKEAQKQWIGRSKGARLNFALSTGETVTVFTTRPDTLYGVTYLVLAPEHELIQSLLSSLQNKDEVTSYIHATSQKDERARTHAEKEKTGVLLQGISAIHPITKEPLPVYIADYVLAGYGTGAVMAVPAHDERDFVFAQKYSLPVREVIEGEGPLPRLCYGILCNSGEHTGMHFEEAKKAITERVGGELTSTYRLRDWSIGRQRYWGVPIPIVYDPEGTAHPIPKEYLPWILPTDVDCTPTGEPPLAKSQELKERVERIFGKGWTPEVETMDTFVDSSWYFIRYLDPHNESALASPERIAHWMPIDVYFGGAEHTTMHVLYSRFWHEALYDMGIVPHKEPYTLRLNRGLVLGPDGNKMSKSKGNVVDPDEHVERMGSDTVKMYLAFMGPYGDGGNYPWDLGGIAGLRRFLERVNGLSEHFAEEAPTTTTLLHKTIDKVRRDISLYKFNTAISALMIFINHAEEEGITRDDYKTFLVLLAPFAPHLTEELWHTEGETHSIHSESFPEAKQEYVQDATISLSVQINGKMRGTITISRESGESEVLSVIASDTAFQRYLVSEPKRVIYVKGKVINIVL